MSKTSVFRQAIDDGHGSVNVGYLTLFWTLVVWAIVSLGILEIGAFAVAAASDANKAAVLTAIGVAEVSAAGGFATVVGTMGFYLWGDSRTPHPPGPTSMSTVTATTTVTP